MFPDILPDWIAPADLAAAKVAQQAMAARVIRTDAHGTVRRVGGVDVSSGGRFDPDPRIHAAIVVLSWPDLTPLAEAAASVAPTMPYIPGYLGFREIPALLAAWQALDPKPDLLMVDGHGIAHPRGLGIAAHLGVVLDLPSIGVAKSLLVGAPEPPVGEARGDRAPLLWRGERIGTSLRTKRRSNPLHVSIGHRVSLAAAEAWVEGATRLHRLPEPTRRAHEAANRQRRGGA